MSDFRRSVMATTNAAREMQRQNASSQNRFKKRRASTSGALATTAVESVTYGANPGVADRMYFKRIPSPPDTLHVASVSFYVGDTSTIQTGFGIYRIDDTPYRLTLVWSEVFTPASITLETKKSIPVGEQPELSSSENYVLAVVFTSVPTGVLAATSTQTIPGYIYNIPPGWTSLPPVISFTVTEAAFLSATTTPVFFGWCQGKEQPASQLMW